MKKTAYGKPLLINAQNSVTQLARIEAVNELMIQDLIFDYPDCLPISEIDESFNPVIPVCKELNTPVGPLDVLMITPSGEITIIETKLWRNPEARRKVVAQILDYAKELATWSYEDLQREINRKLKRKGNTLYKIVQENHSDLLPSESDFVDSVSRNLSRGKFLLLIVGDGMREGAIGISEFLSGASHLHFAFAMVELSLYQGDGIGTLILPKTIVKTVELPKLVVEIPEGLRISYEDDTNDSDQKETPASSPEKERERQFYIKFWNELIRELTFDDPGQPLPKPATSTNLYVYPGRTKRVWISAYFSKSSKRVGVYFRTQNDQEGNEVLAFLDQYKDEMREEFGEKVIWNWDESNDIYVRLSCENVFAPENREEIKEFFKYWLNEFVNVLRPRLKKRHQS